LTDISPQSFFFQKRSHSTPSKKILPSFCVGNLPLVVPYDLVAAPPQEAFYSSPPRIISFGFLAFKGPNALSFSYTLLLVIPFLFGFFFLKGSSRETLLKLYFTGAHSFSFPRGPMKDPS